MEDPPEEVRLEEVYLFKLNPAGGFGVQVSYDDNGKDEAALVRTDDVAVISSGYHPVVAAPGYALYYLWIMAGPGGRWRPTLTPDMRGCSRPRSETPVERPLIWPLSAPANGPVLESVLYVAKVQQQREVTVDDERARELLAAERRRVEHLLQDTVEAGQDDRGAANQSGDMADPAERLTAEEVDDAVTVALRDRLAAVERAEARLGEGTFGRSVRSGVPIPDDRLEADPAAELTVEESAQG